MLTLSRIAAVLRLYASRFKYLDVFADDIQEVRTGVFQNSAVLVSEGPPTRVVLSVDGRQLAARIYEDQGIIRFSRPTTAPTTRSGDQAAAGALIGGALGTAIGHASEAKEGALGGLLLGVLAGALIGGAGQRPPARRAEKVLALRYDEQVGDWVVYSGPLLPWAKQALEPPG